MSFGLTNAPAFFMYMMNSVFMEYLDKFVRRGTRGTSKISVAKLREHKLYAKFSKCDFWIEEVKFLGHVISNGGIAVDRVRYRSANRKIPRGCERHQEFSRIS
ncbi:hypothetical protein U9M48_019230 [Paspalum notatum var. saurae]|uniref:Uncharacterized protein n=1 Tax=Paspalum notatum var. saurae TaxID=547442 RepID=A0AAQ3TB09_PASNO